MRGVIVGLTGVFDPVFDMAWVTLYFAPHSYGIKKAGKLYVKLVPPTPAMFLSSNKAGF